MIWWKSVKNWFGAERVARRDLEVEITWDVFTRLFMEQFIEDAIRDFCQT